jgi:hypothetical protein
VIDGSAPVRDVLIESGRRTRRVAPPGRQTGEADRQVVPWLGTRLLRLQHRRVRVDTIKPGAVMGRSKRPMAPHVNFWIARSIGIGLMTRMPSPRGGGGARRIRC